MAKPKRRHLSSPAIKKIESDEEDGWIIVKKQKVTIIIPPSPVTELPTVPNLEINRPQASPMAASTDPQSQLEETQPEIRLSSEGEKLEELAVGPVVPSAEQVPLSEPILSTPKPSESNHEMSLENLGNGVNGGKTYSVLDFAKASSIQMVLIDRRKMSNRRMRALNIERKILKAGGLSSWLVSLGLDYFVKVFQGKCVNKFQLANLTMEKLKDMGVSAVGPRRKLINAIDSVCQPYSFEQ